MGMSSMADSLRARLLGWYAVMIMLIVAMVGIAVCWVTWRSRLTTIDGELRARAETVAGAVRPGPGGAFDVELPPEATTYFQERERRPFYAVWTVNGSLVDRSEPDIALAGAPEPGARTRGSRREVVIRSRGFTILSGRDIADLWRELWSLAGTMMAVGLTGIAAALAAGWLFSGRALGPLQRINETARRMAGGDLTARIAVDRLETDLGQVALALNLAFDRQRESIERQRRFSADASHELRTPVSTIIAELDWALMRERTAADYRSSLETCRRAGGRLQALVEGLLTLARADSGELPIRRQEVRLDRIVAEAVDLLRPLAQKRGVTFQFLPGAQTVSGDPDRLHDLVSSLLFNAVAYNRQDGRVDVALDRHGASAVLRIRDTGIGIGPEDLPRVFDRFYRSDAARAREPGGAGLGLALAKWIATAHGGSVACTSELGHYTELVVEFPAAHAATVIACGRLNARLANPPSAPMASAAHVTAGVQMDPRPSAASSE